MGDSMPVYIGCNGFTVHTLRSASDWDAWNIGITACLFPRNVHRQLLSTDEPFRETEYSHHITFYQPPDEHCGECPPRGKLLSVAARATQGVGQDMDPSKMQIWSDWAEKERLARSALLTTVTPALLNKVQHTKLWSARDIYNALGAVLHGYSSSYGRDDNLRRLQTMCLDGGSSQELSIHLYAFKGLAARVEVSDQVKVDIFLRSLLDPITRAGIEDRWKSLIGDGDGTWGKLSNMVRIVTKRE